MRGWGVSFYFFLLGILPFVNVYRFGPVPTFWTEWAVACMAIVWSIQRTWQTRSEGAALRPTWVTIGLAGLSLLLFVQFQQGMAASRINALVAAALLLLCIVFYEALRGSITSDTRESFLRAWSLGVLVTLVCQVIVALLLWSGMDWTPFQLISVEVPERMFGTFGQPNQFGVFVLLSMATLLFLARRRIISSSFFLLMWLLASVLVAASESRAAWVCWLVLVGIHLFLFRAPAAISFSRRLTNGWGLLFLHGLFVAIQIVWSMRGGGGSAVVKLTKHAYDTASIYARYEQYRDSFDLIEREPIFGYGFENFAQARFYNLMSPLQEPQAIHTHNIFTNVYIDFGLPGFVFLMFILISVMFAGVRSLKARGADVEASALVCSWVSGYFVYACLEHPFNYAHFLLVFFAMLAFLPVAEVRFMGYVSFPFRMGRLLVLVVMLCGVIFLAFDYRRIQVMVLNVEAQIRRFGEIRQFPPFLYLFDLRQKTVFVDYVDVYMLQSMGPGGELVSRKIEVARRLFERGPKGDTLALYVSHLVAGELAQQQEALALMCLMGQRNRLHFDWAMRSLRDRAPFEVHTQAFLVKYQNRLRGSCR